MTFSDFAQKLFVPINDGSSQADFVELLFWYIAPAQEATDKISKYSRDTLKKCYNGDRGIGGIAKIIHKKIDTDSFISFLNEQLTSDPENMRTAIETFNKEIPDVNEHNICQKLADVFAEIIRAAALSPHPENTEKKGKNKKKKKPDTSAKDRAAVRKRILKLCEQEFDAVSNRLNLNSFQPEMCPKLFDSNQNPVAPEDTIKKCPRAYIGQVGGSGKSFMTAHAMGELLKSGKYCIWISCKDIVDRTSIFKQLNAVFPDNAFPENIQHIEYCSDLAKVLNSCGIERVYIFLDGFNECVSKGLLLEFISELEESDTAGKIHIIVTSRFRDPQFNHYKQYELNPLSEDAVREIIEKEIGPNSYELFNPRLKILITRPFFLALALKNRHNIGSVFSAAKMIETEINRIKANYDGRGEAQNEDAVNWFSSFVFDDYTKKNRRLHFLKDDLPGDTAAAYFRILQANRIIVCEDGKNCYYPHEHFRDYFVAASIHQKLRQASENNSAEEVNEIFNGRLYSDIVLQFLGELSGQIKEGNLIISALDLLGIPESGYSGTNREATAALIKSLILSSEGDIREVNLSRLDLTATDLNEVIPGTEFSGCEIAKSTFLRNAHSSGVRSFETVCFYKRIGRRNVKIKYVLSFGNSDMLLIEYNDFKVVRKYSFDDTSGYRYALSEKNYVVSSAAYENTALAVTIQGDIYKYSILEGETIEEKKIKCPQKAVQVRQYAESFFVLLESGIVVGYSLNGEINEIQDKPSCECAESFCFDKDGRIIFIGSRDGKVFIRREGEEAISTDMVFPSEYSSGHKDLKSRKFISFKYTLSENESTIERVLFAFYDIIWVYDFSTKSCNNFTIGEAEKRSINYVDAVENSILVATENGYILKYSYYGNYDNGEPKIIKAAIAKIDKNALSVEKVLFDTDTQSENKFIIACSLNRQMLKYSDDLYEINRIRGNYSGLRSFISVNRDSFDELLVTSYDGCVLRLCKIQNGLYHCTAKVKVDSSWIWSIQRISSSLFVTGSDSLITLFALTDTGIEIVDTVRVEHRPECLICCGAIIYAACLDKIYSFNINYDDLRLESNDELKFPGGRKIFTLAGAGNMFFFGWSSGRDEKAGISSVSSSKGNMLSENYQGRVRDIKFFGKNLALIIGTNHKNKEFFSVICQNNGNEFIEISKLTGHSTYIVKGAVREYKEGFLIATVGDDNCCNFYYFDEEKKEIKPFCSVSCPNKLFDVMFVDEDRVIVTCLNGDLASVDKEGEYRTLFKNKSGMFAIGANFTGVKIEDEELRSTFEFFNNKGIGDEL